MLTLVLKKTDNDKDKIFNYAMLTMLLPKRKNKEQSLSLVYVGFVADIFLKSHGQGLTQGVKVPATATVAGDDWNFRNF